MASIISSGTTSGTALNFSGDTSGVLQLATNGTTTALSISTAQVVTLTNALPVTSGGTGVTTSTGTGANVLGTSPTISGAVLSSMASSVITSGTAVASTSGTTIDFTAIPSWVKRITVLFNGLSISGTSNPLIQIGTGGVPTTSGYLATSGNISGGSASQNNYTAGFGLNSGVSSNTVSGATTIFNISGNIWVASGTTKNNTSATQMLGGNVTLGGTLNMVRITAVNGTDTFTAGSINILYE